MHCAHASSDTRLMMRAFCVGQSGGVCDQSTLDAAQREWSKQLADNLARVESHVPQVCWFVCFIEPYSEYCGFSIATNVPGDNLTSSSQCSKHRLLTQVAYSWRMLLALVS